MEDKKIIDDIFNLGKSSDCINDELLCRYIDATVTKSEAAAIEKHLNSCPACFNDMVSIVKNSLSPITDFEKNEINKLRTITRDEQVTRILKHYEPPKRSRKVKTRATIKQRVEEFYEKWIYIKSGWRPAIVTSALIIFFASIYLVLKYYNTDYQISQAEKLLLNKYRVYIESPRLSGGYRSTGISLLMGHEDAKLSYVEKTQSKLNKAIESGSKSIKAKQLLAQTFIIEQQNASADSIFKVIGDKINTSASLLNDRGVFYFQKGDWEQAEYNFEVALKVDKNFLEAYYNLALTKIKMHDLNEALIYLEKYQTLEHNEDWKNAAQSLINKINKNELLIY